MNSPDPDHIRYTQIAAAAARYVQGWRFTGEEEAAGIAELAQAAAGRADLLAERAGTALGFSEGGLERARNRQIAELCIAAGADEVLIGRWIEVGRELAAGSEPYPPVGPPGDCAPALRADRCWDRAGGFGQVRAEQARHGPQRALSPPGRVLWSLAWPVPVAGPLFKGRWSVMVNDTREQALHDRAAAQLKKRRDFRGHLLVYVLVNTFLVVIWAVIGVHGFFWPVFPIVGWGIGVVMNAWDVYWRPEITEQDIQREIEREDKRV